MSLARISDPVESHDAIPDLRTRQRIIAAVAWLYTLGAGSDAQIADLYFEHVDSHPDWPMCDWESVRKRCSDLRRLDRRVVKVGETVSSWGKRVGVYGYGDVA